MFDEGFLMPCSAPSALQQFLYIFMNIIVLGTLKNAAKGEPIMSLSEAAFG